MAQFAVEFLEKQHWLDAVGERIGERVGHVYERIPNGPAVREGLRGEWLGHPLHVALSDVPIGAWTVGLAFDTLEVTGSGEFAPAADIATGVGLAAAATAAATGWSDWTMSQGRSRRVGLAHGLLNGAAAGCYAASLILRRGTRTRRAGQVASLIGYGLASAAGWLGGVLVYDRELQEERSRLMAATNR